MHRAPTKCPKFAGLFRRGADAGSGFPRVAEAIALYSPHFVAHDGFVTSLPTPRRAVVVVIGAFAALVLGYAIWAAFDQHHRIGFGPDSALYIAAAHAPVWSRKFYAGPGGFGFLLLAKVSARNLRAIVLLQSVIAVGAWSFLAITVSGVARNKVARWVGLIAILGVALAAGVLQWNAFISTESLSISALCAVLACALRLVQRGARRDVAWFVAALAAFAFIRDTNALLVGVLAIAAFACALHPDLRVRGLVIGAACIALALSATSLSNAADPPRWYWPIAETTAMRMLADPGAAKYIQQEGFPMDEHTRMLPKTYIYSVAQVRHDESFSPFRRWVRSDGRRVYVNFLRSHPGWALRKPFNERDALFNVGVVERYSKVYRNHPGVPLRVVGAIAVPHSGVFTEIWTLVAVVALALMFWKRSVPRRLLGVAGLAIGLAVLGYFAAWYGDVLEVYRHSMSAAVELRIALWLVTVFAIDAVATRADSATRQSFKLRSRPAARRVPRRSL